MENVGCPDEDAGDDGTEDEDNAGTSYTQSVGACRPNTYETDHGNPVNPVACQTICDNDYLCTAYIMQISNQRCYTLAHDPSSNIIAGDGRSIYECQVKTTESNAVVTSYTEIAGRCLRKSEWNDWDWDDNL